MISFQYDYTDAGHPRILEALLQTAQIPEKVYGYDKFSDIAEKLIQKEVENTNTKVHFLTGGTQSNLVCLSHILRPYEAIIASKEGHICTHETGAIEATGHRIIELDHIEGKISAVQIEKECTKEVIELMVKPKVVYISLCTELGTIYSKQELENISTVCKNNNLYLYIDGARLGSALTCKSSDFTLKDIAKYADIFYIGGTKNGAIFGEAVVITNKDLQDNFKFTQRQRGALLAKGRVISQQFIELFKDNLFYSLGKHSNKMSEKLVHGITSLGYKFLSTPQTNIIFPIFPNKIIKELQKKYSFYIWTKENNYTSSTRFVTSWITKKEEIQSFLLDLKNLSKENC